MCKMKNVITRVIVYVINWKYFKSQYKTFPFGQISIKYEIWEFDVRVMFKNQVWVK